MASSKQRAQGGGRKANSEPRVQVFRDFNGCNFDLSPHDWMVDWGNHEEQSDLQLNYVVVQNNAGITSNKTIETRNNLEELTAQTLVPKFTGVSLLVDNDLYLAQDDGNIVVYDIIDPEHDTYRSMAFVSAEPVIPSHHWQSLVRVDDKIVGTTIENELWTGDVGAYTLESAKFIPNPSALSMAYLDAKGSLKISSTMSDDYPYRVAIAFAWVNKYGPTKHSPQLTFYANYPVDEWHGGRYLQVTTPEIPETVLAAEFFYTTGNSSTLLFAGRSDNAPSSYGFEFSWFGYLDAVNMWPVANLIAPTENYTKGVTASHVTSIDGRLYFWGDSEKPYRLYIGGNPGNLFSISPGTGGGFVDVEPGSGQEIRVVTKYKTQSGASIITVLTDSPHSNLEQRYNLVENSISLSNEQNMKSWQAEQVAGSVGCKSYNGAIVCEDGLYSVSRYGLALTTMTMEYNSQIRTTYVSDAIKPAFTDTNRSLLFNSFVTECDGVIYLAFGSDNVEYDNILFCYDIDLKAWWTVTLDVDDPIVGLVHIDYEHYREGIGAITPYKVYLLPLTMDDDPSLEADFDVLIRTGELSTMQPQQNWFYLSQLEFRFDYFIGSVLVELVGIDQFGRLVKTEKRISHDEAVFNETEWMRVDLRLQSYQLRITGQARFRMTHFMAKLYTMSTKQGLVWGFNDKQGFRPYKDGDIHPTFMDYNDIKKAIIP